MFTFPPTIILRHRRENLRKCSLRGLESREDLSFFTYPKDSLPIVENYLLLSMDGEALSERDRDLGLLLLDGTWRYAEKMKKSLSFPLIERSIPPGFQTAYPRSQEDCKDPTKGLASVEALYIAYVLMGRDPKGLLDHYYWREKFLELNRKHLERALSPTLTFSS
ncbi:MAG: hypothetical protein HYX48_01450 [Chlamydiales bacterium]|nr:hypothetical protein [Chlamydiales bacterium]